MRYQKKKCVSIGRSAFIFRVKQVKYPPSTHPPSILSNRTLSTVDSASPITRRIVNNHKSEPIKGQHIQPLGKFWHQKENRSNESAGSTFGWEFGQRTCFREMSYSDCTFLVI